MSLGCWSPEPGLSLAFSHLCTFGLEHTFLLYLLPKPTMSLNGKSSCCLPLSHMLLQAGPVHDVICRDIISLHLHNHHILLMRKWRLREWLAVVLLKYVHTCFDTPPFKRWNLIVLPMNVVLQPCLVIHFSQTECGGSRGFCLPRVSHKRHSSYVLVLESLTLKEASHHVMRTLKQPTERSCGGTEAFSHHCVWADLKVVL